MSDNLEGRGPQGDLKKDQQLRAELAAAGDRIARLESRLASTGEALDRVLADDLRACEELAALQKMIWGYHRGLPDGCKCPVCEEVERSKKELRDLF